KRHSNCDLIFMQATHLNKQTNKIPKTNFLLISKVTFVLLIFFHFCISFLVFLFIPLVTIFASFLSVNAYIYICLLVFFIFILYFILFSFFLLIFLLSSRLSSPSTHNKNLSFFFIMFRDLQPIIIIIFYSFFYRII